MFSIISLSKHLIVKARQKAGGRRQEGLREKG
jgi:hypothetical protein